LGHVFGELLRKRLAYLPLHLEELSLHMAAGYSLCKARRGVLREAFMPPSFSVKKPIFPLHPVQRLCGLEGFSSELAR
jgi:hypothetical protein